MSIPNLDALQVIADPSRRQILQLLTKKPHNINALAQNFDMSRPAVSKHIKILAQAGFITIQEIGRERHCVLNQKGFNDVKALISHFDQFWENKLSKLETILNRKKD